LLEYNLEEALLFVNEKPGLIANRTNVLLRYADVIFTL